jgi:CubicO group peptidase (beta-lactamase class C family)
MSQLAHKSIEEIYAHIVEMGFDGPRGERAYTNLPSYVLGVIIEEVAKKPLAELAQEYFFEPLHMTSTTYFPDSEGCPPTEIQGGEIIQGIVHDESARVFAKAGRAVGHAGLFSNAADLLLCLEAILNDKYPEVRNAAVHGLGWEHADGRFGKTGFTGTNVLVDPATKSALVILSNRTYPTRPLDSTAINSFRRDIAAIVFG